MRVLQLDVAMRPVELIHVHDAVSKIALGRAQAVLSDENVLYRSTPGTDGLPKIVVPKPIIIQIPHYVELRPIATKYVIRRVLYARDRWTCQYCGASVSLGSATLDHVKPLSRGGAHSWDNVVTACRPCNIRKGDRLPFESRMMPMTVPKAPHFVQVQFAGRVEPIQARYIAEYYRLDSRLLGLRVETE
jgi:hypothetical protein